MFYVYTLKSTTRDYIYVGLTQHPERRLREHNAGHTQSTKAYSPFEKFYQEELPDRTSARVREKYLKSAAGKRYLRKFLRGLEK